jgi:hypothetical protein
VEGGSVVDLPGAPRRPYGNLPSELTSFIGRERETAEMKRSLGDVRLLTLTGPGGCGKTRLALAVGEDLTERFEGGVWWVELAQVSDPALVPWPQHWACTSRWAARWATCSAIIWSPGGYS